MGVPGLKRRMQEYGLRAIRVVKALLRGPVGWMVAGQLARSACSVGANYRSACRARSRADFIAKLKIVEEECDESVYWLEVASESGLLPPARLFGLLREGNELLSIVIASIRTARSRS